MKKLFTFIIALFASVALLNAETYSGSCGENLTWSLNTEDSVLTISGTGAMADYQNATQTPWNGYSSLIQSVIMNDNVTTVSNYAFAFCSNLKNVSLNQTLTTIGEHAFFSCPLLESVVIPDNVIVIGYNAFAQCSWLTSVHIGNKVTTIGKGAFARCGRLNSVVMFNSVTSIGENAFDNCSALTTINIPNSITSIGKETFAFCAALTSIEIPESVTSIGENAFYGCSGLTSVTIPNSVTSIGDGAFNGCSNLTTTTNFATTPQPLDPDGISVFGGVPLACTLYVPAQSIALYKAADVWKEFGNILAIDDSTEEVNYTTLADIYNMAADSAFTLGAFDVMYVPDFQSGSNMYIKDSTGSCVIYKVNYGLQAGDHVEAGLQGKVSIYNGLHEVIPITAKEDLTITHGEAPAPMVATEAPSLNNASQYVVYEGVSFTTDTAFVEGRRHTVYGSWNGQMITFYNQYYIGATLSANKTYNITAVNTIYRTTPQAYPLVVEEVSPAPCIIASGTCGNRLTWELSCDSVLTISGTGAMTSYSSDTIVPWSSYRTSIASVVVGEGITRIANYSFQACENLRSVTLPTSVTEIRDFSFSGCTSLISIEIPNSVTRIRSNAFGDCDALTSIDIPYSVTNIQDNAFRGCNSLNSINVDSENPNYTSVDGVLFNKEATELIQYPAGKNNTSYSIPNSVTSIGKYAFYDCNNLTSVEIPNSVTLIGWGAFCGCEGLTSITVPNSVTSIGTTAFSYCYNLTSVTLPDSITSISMALFEYSNRLTSVIIPDGVTSIGYQAFLACSGLTSITIPNSVISIENYAFYGCRNLTAITNYAITPQTINTEVFSNFNKSTCTLYVPAESLEAYKAAEVWKEFGNIVAIEGGDTPSPEERTGRSTEGKDFWVTFMQADQDPNNDLVLSLSISSREDCQVMIANPYTGYMETVNVTANQMQLVELYSGNVLLANARTTMANSGKVCYAGYSEQVDTCALRVTATSDISLFATNYKRATFDATNVLPTALLGDEYIIQTYTPSDHGGVDRSQGSHFAIIATEDNTIVDYCPTVMTEGVNNAIAMYEFTGGVGMSLEELAQANWQVGDTLYTPVLMAGQVFYVWTGKKDGETGDLSGTYVKARNGKRIAVFQGNPHTNIPYQVKQRDQLYSQAMPVQSWGSTFALTSSATRPSDIIRVMAIHDGTEVRINGETVHTFDFTVDTKHYWEFEIGPSGTYAQEGSCMLTTSQPVAVHLFLTSQQYKGDKNSNGDPAMLWVSPTEHQMDQVSFATYSGINGAASYVNIVTDKPEVMTLDGASITSNFSPVDGSNTYYYAQVALGTTAASHTLKSNGGKFNAHVYGFSSNESYAYSAGSFIEDLTASIYINGEQVSPVNDMCVVDTFFMDITTSFDYQSMKLDFGDGTVVYATDEEGIHARHAYEAPGVYHANVVVASNNNRLDSISIRIFAGRPSLTYEPLNDIYVGDSIFYIYYHSPIQEMQIEEDFTIDRSFNDAALQDGFGHYTTRLNRSFFGVRIPEGARVGVVYALNVDIHTLCGDYTATIPFVLKNRRTGSCGDNMALTWTYDPETKTLTITGDGALNSNYTFGLEAPLEMEQLIIAEGVTSIGANAFSNMSTLQTMQLPASLKTIGASAFENDINLTAIYNYRERPCLVDATAFNGVNKFDCTLYVLEGSVDMYKSSISDWKDFYYTYAIGAEETTIATNDVQVEPQDNAATLTWPTSNNAASYTIQITKDGVVFCTLIFNANGQLTGIAFAPSCDGQAHAPAALMTANGLQFTVTGLNSNTQYGYNLTARDANDQTVATYSGEFTTTSEGVATGFEDVQSDDVQCTKVVRNGQIFILRGDKTYTLTGQEVR